MDLNAEPWASIEGIYRATLRHPFIKRLADGTLKVEHTPHEIF